MMPSNARASRSEGKIGTVALNERNTFFCFYDRKAYCAFFVPFSLKNQRKENKNMEDLIIIPIGDVEIESLTKEQEQELIACLFQCFVKIYETKEAKGVK